MNSKKSIFTRKRIVTLAIILALVVLAILAFDSRLLIRRYTIEAEEITNSIRIALVTDLHSCKYGEGQSELIEAVAAQNPDVVFLVGDIFDDVLEDTNTELFLAGIADKYPCYYVTGNHECWSGSYNFSVKMSILEKYDIPVLSGETMTLTVNGETINLCGVDDPHIYLVEPYDETKPKEYLDEYGNQMQDYTGRLNAVHEAVPNDNYTILLSHRPEFFDLYAEYDFDLVLCGHAHGGQWRIPGILNGLYAPHQGIFPKYAGGRYDAENMTMIVSRGLARETTWVPRIFNRPELVVIDLE
ncbi:MAG: metallophosphoesterase [Clostridia bacterium]|nr:metallophosphoesterase [Clostridia bacterium]